MESSPRRHANNARIRILYRQAQSCGTWVARELTAVGAAERSGSIPHRSYLDASFTAATLAHGLQEASMVHIASHFVLRPGLGDASYLLMGDGQRLSLADLADRRFRFDDLDLWTLSACEMADFYAAPARGFKAIGTQPGRMPDHPFYWGGFLLLGDTR